MLTFPYQDADKPNLNLSAVVNYQEAEVYSSPSEPHKVPLRLDHFKPKLTFQPKKLVEINKDEITKTLYFKIQKLERKFELSCGYGNL